ncbi:MAG: formate dehydrogenase accessory sulfurtransferase FdhD [Candidatus Bathyarchaeia archaeon]
MEGASKIREVEIVRIDTDAKKAEKVRDYIAEEKPLHIFLNRTRYATVFCLPTNLKELAVGHLLTEGVINSTEEIAEINFKEEGVYQIKLKPEVNIENRLKLLQKMSRIILSACGGPHQPSTKLPKIRADIKVKAETVQKCVNNLNFIAETFRKTGGVHVAALYKSDGALLAFAEDVGRHNAVDKAIGIGAFSKVNFSECFLAISGRLTGDMVFKAAKVGLPIVASLAAALDSGIEIAKKANITLIGFVRGKCMNVYTAPERVSLESS